MPTASVPNTFSNIPAATNPIDATQVNANFAALLAAINGQIGSDNLNAALQAFLIPTATIITSAASATPTGFLICDFAAVSRTTYAVLFAAIGTTHGAGDGSTTFNTPDFRGRSPLGVGTAAGAAGATAHTLGQKSGEETHVLTVAELAQHAHGVTDPGHTHGYTAGHGSNTGSDFSATADSLGNGTNATNSGGTGISIQNSGSNTAHNVMHPYTGVNFFIKT